VLSSFGVFFASEGLGVSWPGSDAALLYLVAAFLTISQIQIHLLTREREREAVPA
jgi:Ca2+/H+ antiporter, TMEM165/GDT1 family